MLRRIISEHDQEEGDETDAVNILINTLKREGTAETADLDTIAKLRTVKGRVSFDVKTEAYPQQIDEGRNMRRSLVISNAPINKDHQTLLGISMPSSAYCSEYELSTLQSTQYCLVSISIM